MKVVLIYDSGDEWNERIEIKEFDNEGIMIKFINENKIGDSVKACYNFIKEIKVEPFEKVVEYRIKD